MAAQRAERTKVLRKQTTGRTKKYLICRNLRAFWEDQTDQKSAVGGPKQILRTGVFCFHLCGEYLFNLKIIVTIFVTDRCCKTGAASFTVLRSSLTSMAASHPGTSSLSSPPGQK